MNTAHDHWVCCFCDNEVYYGHRVCYTCNEYKGIMTVEAYQDYLKVPFYCSCQAGLSDPYDMVIS